MIELEFNKDFTVDDFGGGIYDDSLTLSADEIWANNTPKVHEDGWIICGKYMCDYIEYAYDFVAMHPVHGFVRGDFDEIIYASSREAYENFLENHSPFPWNSMDI